jgi:hypothetical protein
VAPTVVADTQVRYLDPAAPWATQAGAVPRGTRLAPSLITRVQLLFDDTKADLRETVEWEALVRLIDRDVDWGDSVQVDYDERDLRDDPLEGAVYTLSDAPIANSTFFRSATAGLKRYLHREETLTLQSNRELKLYSRVGEAPEAFAARCRDAAEDAMDDETEKIRDRLTAKMDKVNAAIARYEDRIDELHADVRNRRTQDLISIGSSVLGSILGGRQRASTIARSAGRAATRSASSAQRIRTIENRIDEKNLDIEDLEEDLAEALAEIEEEWSGRAEAIEPLEVSLEKTDITVDEVGLVWVPVG